MKYKIDNEIIYEKHLLVQLRIMITPMDPDPYRQISHKIEEWLESEIGQWVQLHCKDLTKEEYKHYDPASDQIVNVVRLIGYCLPKDWTFFILRWS